MIDAPHTVATLDDHALHTVLRRSGAPAVVLACVCRRWADAVRPTGRHRRGRRPLRSSTRGAVRQVARADNVALLRWLRNVCRMPVLPYALIRLARRGAVACLGAMADVDGLRLHAAECARAAARGNRVAVLRWMRGRGCATWFSATDEAARCRSAGALRWLLAHGAARDELTFAAAAQGGCVRAMRLLAASGCGVCARAYGRVAQHGQLRALRWLCRRHVVSAGRVLDYSRDLHDECVLGAARGGQIRVLRWCQPLLPPPPPQLPGPFSQEALSAAVGSGCLRAVRWMLRETSGAPGMSVVCIEGMFRVAASHGHVAMLSLLRAAPIMRCASWPTISRPSVCRAAYDRRHDAVVRWIWRAGCRCGVHDYQPHSGRRLGATQRRFP